MRHALLQGEMESSDANIDAVDRRILNLLQEDSRLSFNKIAIRAKISVGTAYNRIKNLEAKGILKGYTVIIDTEKLGYNLTAVIFVQAEGANSIVLEEEIAKADNVIAAYDVTGEFDAAIIAKFKNRNDLSSFIKLLAAKAYVKRTITNVSLQTVKEDFTIKVPQEEIEDQKKK